MDLSARILGKHTSEVIAAKATTPLLTIGSDKFFRRDLSSVSCFNFTAAANLSAVLAGLQPRNTKHLFESIPPSALVLPHLGAVSLAVLGAAFEVKGLGGDSPLEAWFTRHRPEQAKREFVTFHAMKHAEHLRELGEAKARKARSARTHARRDVAQRLRGQRYIERQERVNNA